MLLLIKEKWSIFYADTQNQRFVHIILLAVLLRIVLMPFFGHMDVLSEARRVFFWAENNIFFGNIARNTTMFIEVLFYHATSFLLQDDYSMFFINDITHSTASIPHYFEFVSHYTIFRTMFVLKIPYLVFDILTAVVLYNYFQDKEKGLSTCKLWLFNPVTIFAFYIYGRFESIPIFFIAAGLLALKKNRVVLAAILVGLCLNGREMMIIYSPIFIFTVLFASLKSIDLKRKIIAILIVFGLAIVALQLYTYIMPDAVGGKVGTIMNEGRVKHLFAFSLHRIMFIPFIYVLILLWISSSEISAHRKLLLGCAIVMMSFFAFSSHSVHFTSWMIIFPVIFYGENKKLLMPFCGFCIAWFVYWMFSTDLGVFTLWLASPYSLHFIGIPNISMYLEKIDGHLGIFNRPMLIYLSRTVLVATIFYMAGMMLKITLKSHDGKNS